MRLLPRLAALWLVTCLLLQGARAYVACSQPDMVRVFMRRSRSWLLSLPDEDGRLRSIDLSACYSWNDELDLGAPANTIRSVQFRLSDCANTPDGVVAHNVTVSGWASASSCFKTRWKTYPVVRKEFKLGRAIGNDTIFAVDTLSSRSFGNTFPSIMRLLNASTPSGRSQPVNKSYGVLDWCVNQTSAYTKNSGYIVGRVSEAFGMGPLLEMGTQAIGNGLCRKGSQRQSRCPSNPAIQCDFVTSTVRRCQESGSNGTIAEFSGAVTGLQELASRPSNPVSLDSVLSGGMLEDLRCTGQAARRPVGAVVSFASGPLTPASFDAMSPIMVKPREPDVINYFGLVVLYICISLAGLIGILFFLQSAYVQCCWYPLSRRDDATLIEGAGMMRLETETTTSRYRMVDSKGRTVEQGTEKSSKTSLVVGFRKFSWDGPGPPSDTRLLVLPGSRHVPMAVIDRVWKGNDRSAVNCALFVALVCLIIAVSTYPEVPLSFFLIFVVIYVILLPPWHHVCTCMSRYAAERAAASRGTDESPGHHSTINPIQDL